MTEQEAIAEIAERVESLQGVKAVALIATLPEEILEMDPVALISKAVLQGAIEEVEYVLPQLDFRIKSFLLPKGTKARTNAQRF